MNKMRQIIIKVREGDSVFRSNGLSDNNLINVVKLVPIFISTKQRNVFKIGPFCQKKYRFTTFLHPKMG